MFFCSSEFINFLFLFLTKPSLKIQLNTRLLNKGLANSIIEGVTKIINQFGQVIVLEDDLVTTPNFLDYMNSCLDYYENNAKVMSVNGFSLKLKSSKYFNEDIFIMNRTYSWGWATWKDSWISCDFDKKNISESLYNLNIINFQKTCGDDVYRMLISSLEGTSDSWYIRWVYSHFKNSKVSIYPFKSKVENIGYGENATHCTTIDVLKSEIDKDLKQNFIFPNDITVKNTLRNEFLSYFTFKYKLIFRLKMLRSRKGIMILQRDLFEKFLIRYNKFFKK